MLTYEASSNHVEGDDEATYEVHESIHRFMVKNDLAGANGHFMIMPETLKLCRARMILEELGETAEAIHNYDGSDEKLVLVADGLADLLYVSHGLAIISSSVQMKDPWNFDMDQLETWTPLRALMELTSKVSRVLYSLKSPADLRLNLWSLHTGICRVAKKTYHLPFREVFLEIARSNLTKNLKGTKVGEKGDQTPGYKESGYEPPRLLEIIRPCGLGVSGSRTSEGL